MNEQLTHADQPPAAALTPARTDPAPVKPPRRAGWFDSLRQFLPTLLILAVLGVVGVLGYAYDWKVPKLLEDKLPRQITELFNGKPQEEENKDWCKQHGAPADLCVHCDPRRWPADPDYGWCDEHGVFNCALDHPDLAQLPQRPTVSKEERARVATALKLLPRPKNNEKVEPREAVALKRVQLASPETIEKLGLEFAKAERRPVVESISAPGEITYDPTRVARLSSRAPGTVWRMLKQVGDPVERGDVLALVDSAEVGKAKTEFLQALANLELKRDILKRYKTSPAISEAALQQVETAEVEATYRLQSAEQALINLDLPVRAAQMKGLTADQRRDHMQFLGLPPAVVKLVAADTHTANLIPLRAPLKGVVVARNVVAGEVIDTTKNALTVADVSHLWLTLEVRLEDAKYVKLGQSVRFRPDGSDDEVGGKIDWISTQVDPKTRTVEVRVPLDNPGGTLRDHTFGLGRVILREDDQAIVVPSEAVHWANDSFVVFVKDRNFDKEGHPKVFHVRSVRTGARTDDGKTEILVGLFPGEVVATRNSGVLRGDLLKDKIGAGEAD